MKYLPVFSIIMIIISLVCMKNDVQSKEKVIKSIGGCSWDGLCGVTYDDFSTGLEYYPVILKKVKIYEKK